MEQNGKYKISNILFDHGGEFKNNEFDQFCRTQGIHHKFSSPRTPEQNGVVERRNRTPVEMTRTMLIESNLPRKFWAEAVNTSCYIINRAMVRNSSKKTSYEMFKGKKLSLAHFKVFGTRCSVHINDKKNIDKFEPKSEPKIFLGYSETFRAYRIYNLKNDTVEESPHVIFNENFDKSVSQE